VFALLYWLYRNRERLGGGRGYAFDPVCGMQVQIAHAPAHTTFEGCDYWFCCDGCRERFEASPARFTGTPSGSSHGAMTHGDEP
jgi:YHS domain-containing protein